MVTPVKPKHLLSNTSRASCQSIHLIADQGGELYNIPHIRNLFKQFKYEIYPTQNGPVERSRCTVANGIKAILIGAGLDIKFWPYAFNHVIRIRNAIPGQGQVEEYLIFFEILVKHAR
jgi:hypothetical protein